MVYLGDGRGDYCPCTKLGPDDCILARQSYPDKRACALPKLLADQGAAIKDSAQYISSIGAEQNAIPSMIGLQSLTAVAASEKAGPTKESGQCLLTVGAAQKAAPLESRQQHLLPVAASQQHTAVASRGRRQQELAAGVGEQDAGNEQGTAKRHKGQSREQTCGETTPSHPPQQHQPKCEQPDADEIDADKCQHIREASSTGLTICGDDLPLPPLLLSGSMGQHTCVGTCAGEDDLNGVSHGHLQHVGQCSICAPVYTWAQSAEAAKMLHAMVSYDCQVSCHSDKHH